GELRVIEAPRRKLKEVQRRVLDYLTVLAFHPKNCVHGFVAKRSIVSNARAHKEHDVRYLLNIDLQDFFGSIIFKRVRGVMMAMPFNMSYEVATVVAQLACHNGKLPQGAPTSPFLANQVCREMDSRIVKVAGRYRGKYTRYAD